jgi:hypothetical protein
MPERNPSDIQKVFRANLQFLAEVAPSEFDGFLAELPLGDPLRVEGEAIKERMTLQARIEAEKEKDGEI